MIISQFYNIKKFVCTAFSLNVGTYCNNNNTRFKINFRTYIIMIMFQEIGKTVTGEGGYTYKRCEKNATVITKRKQNIK